VGEAKAAQEGLASIAVSRIQTLGLGWGRYIGRRSSEVNTHEGDGCSAKDAEAEAVWVGSG
jgi:hypothetical protein